MADLKGAIPWCGSSTRNNKTYKIGEEIKQARPVSKIYIYYSGRGGYRTRAEKVEGGEAKASCGQRNGWASPPGLTAPFRHGTALPDVIGHGLAQGERELVTLSRYLLLAPGPLRRLGRLPPSPYTHNYTVLKYNQTLATWGHVS